MRTLLLVLLTAVGAFAQKINVEFDPAAPFARYHTFAIRDGQFNSRNPRVSGELVKKRIEADIARELAARGLAMAPGPGPADLNVTYTFGAARGVRPEAYPAGWRGYGTRVVVRHYTEGTLILDLRDARKHELVWRAISVEDNSDPLKIKDHLADLVRKSVEKFPPKK